MSLRPVFSPRAPSAYISTAARRLSVPRVQLVQPSPYSHYSQPTPQIFAPTYVPSAPSYTSRVTALPPKQHIVTVTRPKSPFDDRYFVKNDYQPSSRPVSSVSSVDGAYDRNNTARAAYETLKREVDALSDWQRSTVLKGERLEVARKVRDCANTHLNTVDATYNASLGYPRQGTVYDVGSRRPPLTNTLIMNREAAVRDNERKQKKYEQLDRDSRRDDQYLIQLGKRLEVARQRWEDAVKEVKAANRRARDDSYYTEYSDY